MTALFLQFLSLVAGTVAITTLLLIYRGQRRRFALRYALFLGSLWLVAFSFLLHQLDLLVGDVRLFFAAALVHSLGSLAFVLVAPPCYHAALGMPLTRGWRYLYALLDLLVLLLTVGLAWERYRGLAVLVLHITLFPLVLYGALLVALRYRTLVETSLRRALGGFVLLAAIFLPPLYLESRLELLAPFIHSHWFDSVALPLFFLFLSLLSIPFVLGYLGRPPYFDASGATQFFLTVYSLTPREGEVATGIAKGRPAGEIARELQLSESAVEEDIDRIYERTGVDTPPKLTTLLLANQ